MTWRALEAPLRPVAMSIVSHSPQVGVVLRPKTGSPQEFKCFCERGLCGFLQAGHGVTIHCPVSYSETYTQHCSVKLPASKRSKRLYGLNLHKEWHSGMLCCCVSQMAAG